MSTVLYKDGRSHKVDPYQVEALLSQGYSVLSNADKVAADKVAADKVAADKVAADKVAADKVAAGKVVVDKVAAGKVVVEDNKPAVKSK